MKHPRYCPTCAKRDSTPCLFCYGGSEYQKSPDVLSLLYPFLIIAICILAVLAIYSQILKLVS